MIKRFLLRHYSRAMPRALVVLGGEFLMSSVGLYPCALHGVTQDAKASLVGCGSLP